KVTFYDNSIRADYRTAVCLAAHSGDQPVLPVGLGSQSQRHPNSASKKSFWPFRHTIVSDSICIFRGILSGCVARGAADGARWIQTWHPHWPSHLCERSPIIYPRRIGENLCIFLVCAFRHGLRTIIFGGRGQLLRHFSWPAPFLGTPIKFRAIF